MIRVILLQGHNRHRVEQREDAPELLDYDGVCYSLRAGPRTPHTRMGFAAVPRDDRWIFSRYGSARHAIRTVSPGPSFSHGTSPIVLSG